MVIMVIITGIVMNNHGDISDNNNNDSQNHNHNRNNSSNDMDEKSYISPVAFGLFLLPLQPISLGRRRLCVRANKWWKI